MGSLKAILNKSRKLLFLLLFFSLAAASFSAATFSPNGGNYTYTVGSTVNINISVDGEGELVLVGRTGFLPANLNHSPGVGGIIRAESEEEDPPPGTINISGVISEWARNSTIQFSVQDEEEDDEGDPIVVNSGSYNFTIVLEITTTFLPDATAGEPYSEVLSARGGGDTRTWSLVSGALPPGMSLSDDGFITGAPVTSGTSTFTVQVTDGSQTDQQPFSIAVSPPAIQSLSRYGKICYVKDVVRDDGNGEVVSTGDLYVKDLRTNEERQITNFAGTYPDGALLNPQFTPEGTHLLFTYSTDPGTGDFGVYLVSTGSVLTHPDQEKLAYLESGSKKFAALSPDYSETSGLIVYTLQKSGYTQLWVYDVVAGDSNRIKNDAALSIKHPCFIDVSTIAYVGTISEIQDIYNISAAGGLEANITNNVSPTPQYGRMLTSNRNPGMSASLMIYPMRTKTAWDYTNWDVYTRPVIGAEVNMTLTADGDEYDPAFFGTQLTSPPIGSEGQMFYAAETGSDNVDIWQANYDRNTADTNTAVARRTSGSDTGMVNWGPPCEEEGLVDYVPVQDTRFVYAQSAGGTDQVFRCDYNGTNALQLTSSEHDKSSPSLARDGGVITYIIGEEPHPLHRMHYDGTRDTEVLRDDNWNLQQASISPDGRWIAYVQQTGVDQFDVRVVDINGAVLPLIVGSYAAAGTPSFNQGMTKIVYSAKSDVEGKWDIYTTDVSVDNIAGTVTPLAASTMNITNNPNTDDIYPYFSNDGNKVIFVSDIWDAMPQVFTLDIASTKLEMVVANNAGTDTFSHLMYGPVYDSVAGADMIAYNMNGQVYRAYLYRDSRDNPARGVGTNPVFDITPTGIFPADLKFGWGIARVQGTVVAKRYMAERTAAGVGFEYDIVIDVDENNLPDAYVVSEIIPSDFTVNSVAREGGVPVTYFVMSDNPATGRQTVEIIFGGLSPLDVSDHILRIDLAAPAVAAPYSVEGKVDYMLNDAPATSVTAGNTFVDVAPPFMPVDRYAEGSLSGPDGVIGNFDLLYAITCWKQNAQLQGFGPGWPADIGNWDFILLYIIDIWADATYQGGYEYDSTIPAAADEMYWKPGEWTD